MNEVSFFDLLQEKRERSIPQFLFNGFVSADFHR